MNIIDRIKADPNIDPAFRAALPSADQPVVAPAPGNTLCNFAVAAGMHCPVIISASHALFYWRAYGSIKDFELANVREAMSRLNEAFAAVEALFDPQAISADDAVLQREHQADYDEEHSEGWAAE